MAFIPARHKHKAITLAAACLMAVASAAVAETPAAETPEEAEKRKQVIEQLEQLSKQLDEMNKSLAPALEQANTAMGEFQKANDAMMALGLMGLHARKTMMELCGVTGADADKLRAREDADIQKFTEALSDEAKKNAPGEAAAAEKALKEDWSGYDEARRKQECDAIRAAVARDAAKP